MLGVSYRQAKRLTARYRAEGRKSLVHGNRAPIESRGAGAHRATVLAVVTQHYGGAARPGPAVGAHAGGGASLDRSRPARAGIDAHAVDASGGSLEPGATGAAPAPARERKAHFGELVQLDGSFHDWFEGRGPRGCVMSMVDDATGRTLLRFGAEETTWAAAGVLQAWIVAYGIPRALYTDWKTVYLRAPTTNELARGQAPLTQFGRMCQKLGITLIGASSPQAKGRVERGHGTHQDRLIKKLRLRGIADSAAANVYVAQEYLPAHNGRFAIAPASAVDHHRPRHHARRTDADVFCLETMRTVGHDHVVQYGRRGLQLDPGVRGRVPVKSQVLVRETEEGTLRVVHVARDGRERVLAWTAAAARTERPPTAASRARPAVTPTPPTSGLTPVREPVKPAADHPWRQDQRRWMEAALRRRQAKQARDVRTPGEGDE